MTENRENVTLSPDDVGEVPADVIVPAEGGADPNLTHEESTVSEASDARQVSSESEPDRKARIKRDMAARGRERRGGVQAPAKKIEEAPDGTDDQ